MLIFLLLACHPRDNGETDALSCTETREAIAPDAATSLGFTAGDVAALAADPVDADLAWANGGATVVHLQVDPVGTAWYVHSEAPTGTTGTRTAMWPLCADRVEVDVSWQFSTDDGAFAESWPATLVAAQATEATLHHDLDLAGLVGSFDLVPFVTATDYDALSAWVDATMTGPGQGKGSITGMASGEGPCADGGTCSAWAENVDVATWDLRGSSENAP